MAGSLIDLTECSELVLLAEVVGALRRAAPAYKPLLVGAMARDLLLSYAHAIPIARATLDIDMAFAVSDWQDYDRLRQDLLASDQFFEDRTVQHRMLFRKEARIDLLPFGGVERGDRTIAWPPRQDREMCVIGYKEAMASAVKVSLPLKQQLSVVSLPAMAVIKVVAWRARRYDQPYKDAFDLGFVLRHYLDAGNADRLYREASHLLDDPRFDYLKAGAWLLGSDARKVLRTGDDPETTIQFVANIIEPELDPDGHLRLAGEMRDATPQVALDLLSSFAAGLSGRKCP
jgi:predicted nucleotidyltransferase